MACASDSFFAAKAAYHKSSVVPGAHSGGHRNDRDRPAVILPGLLLAGWSVEANADTLRTHGVTHILQVGFELAPSHGHDYVYRHVPLYDLEGTDILAALPGCLQFIDSCRTSGGTVLVHCAVGVSRSASVVIAYVMWKNRVGFAEARSVVKAARPAVNPNLGFVLQLQRFEQAGWDASRCPPWDLHEFMEAKTAAVASGQSLGGVEAAVRAAAPPCLFEAECPTSPRVAPIVDDDVASPALDRGGTMWRWDVGQHVTPTEQQAGQHAGQRRYVRSSVSCNGSLGGSTERQGAGSAGQRVGYSRGLTAVAEHVPPLTTDDARSANSELDVTVTPMQRQARSGDVGAGRQYEQYSAGRSEAVQWLGAAGQQQPAVTTFQPPWLQEAGQASWQIAEPMVPVRYSPAEAVALPMSTTAQIEVNGAVNRSGSAGADASVDWAWMHDAAPPARHSHGAPLSQPPAIPTHHHPVNVWQHDRTSAPPQFTSAHQQHHQHDVNVDHLSYRQTHSNLSEEFSYDASASFRSSSLSGEPSLVVSCELPSFDTTFGGGDKSDAALTVGVSKGQHAGQLRGGGSSGGSSSIGRQQLQPLRSGPHLPPPSPRPTQVVPVVALAKAACRWLVGRRSVARIAPRDSSLSTHDGAAVATTQQAAPLKVVVPPAVADPVLARVPHAPLQVRTNGDTTAMPTAARQDGHNLNVLQAHKGVLAPALLPASPHGGSGGTALALHAFSRAPQDRVYSKQDGIRAPLNIRDDSHLGVNGAVQAVQDLQPAVPAVAPAPHLRASPNNKSHRLSAMSYGLDVGEGSVVDVVDSLPDGASNHLALQTSCSAATAPGAADADDGGSSLEDEQSLRVTPRSNSFPERWGALRSRLLVDVSPAPGSPCLPANPDSPATRGRSSGGGAVARGERRRSSSCGFAGGPLSPGDGGTPLTDNGHMAGGTGDGADRALGDRRSPSSREAEGPRLSRVARHSHDGTVPSTNWQEVAWESGGIRSVTAAAPQAEAVPQTEAPPHQRVPGAAVQRDGVWADARVCQPTSASLASAQGHIAADNPSGAPRVVPHIPPAAAQQQYNPAAPGHTLASVPATAQHLLEPLEIGGPTTHRWSPPAVPAGHVVDLVMMVGDAHSDGLPAGRAAGGTPAGQALGQSVGGTLAGQVFGRAAGGTLARVSSPAGGVTLAGDHQASGVTMARVSSPAGGGALGRVSSPASSSSSPQWYDPAATSSTPQHVGVSSAAVTPAGRPPPHPHLDMPPSRLMSNGRGGVARCTASLGGDITPAENAADPAADAAGWAGHGALQHQQSVSSDGSCIRGADALDPRPSPLMTVRIADKSVRAKTAGLSIHAPQLQLQPMCPPSLSSQGSGSLLASPASLPPLSPFRRDLLPQLQLDVPPAAPGGGTTYQQQYNEPPSPEPAPHHRVRMTMSRSSSMRSGGACSQHSPRSVCNLPEDEEVPDWS